MDISCSLNGPPCLNKSSTICFARGIVLCSTSNSSNTTGRLRYLPKFDSLSAFKKVSRR